MTRMAPSRDFRIAPELRRCCWYGIVGCAGFFGIVIWISDEFLQDRRTAGLIVCCGISILGAVASSLPLGWRICVDAQGLARRSLWSRDLWTWEDLGSGRIRKRYPYILLDPDRNRKFSLGNLSDADRQEVLAGINARYRLPPPPPIPLEITFQDNNAFLRYAKLDSGGIHLQIRKRTKDYAWSDVRSIHITRLDSLRTDFESLLIVLPDDEIAAVFNTERRSAAAEEINECLDRYVPTDRIDVTIEGEPLTNPEYIKRAINKAEHGLRQWKIIAAVVSLGIIGTLALGALVSGLRAVLGPGCVSALYGGPMLVFGFFAYRLQIRKIAELRDALTVAAERGETSQ